MANYDTLTLTIEEGTIGYFSAPCLNPQGIRISAKLAFLFFFYILNQMS